MPKNNTTKPDETPPPLTISGDITVSSVEKVLQEIRKALKKSVQIKVNVQKVDNYDLAFLQLIMALKKESGIQLDLIDLDQSKLENLGLRILS